MKELVGWTQSNLDEGELHPLICIALRCTQKTIRSDAPHWQPWLEFFLKSLQQQKARLGEKIERERLILGDLPELSVEILELCRERGRGTWYGLN